MPNIDEQELDEALTELEGQVSAYSAIIVGEEQEFDAALDPITRIKALSEFIAETL